MKPLALLLSMATLAFTAGCGSSSLDAGLAPVESVQLSFSEYDLHYGGTTPYHKVTVTMTVEHPQSDLILQPSPAITGFAARFYRAQYPTKRQLQAIVYLSAYEDSLTVSAVRPSGEVVAELSAELPMAFADG